MTTGPEPVTIALPALLAAAGVLTCPCLWLSTSIQVIPPTMARMITPATEPHTMRLRRASAASCRRTTLAAADFFLLSRLFIDGLPRIAFEPAVEGETADGVHDQKDRHCKIDHVPQNAGQVVG